MRRNQRREGIALFISTMFFLFSLIVGGQEALAKGTVTIGIAKGGTPPKVFIVTQNQKGEQIRMPVTAEGGKVEVPEGARLEIVSADRNALIRIEGAVDVAVHGGSPNLQLSGDAMLTVSNAVQAMQVLVEAGNPTMISQSGVTSFTAGQQVALTITETGVNLQPMVMTAPSIPGTGEVPVAQHPGETAGAPSVPGVPQGTGINPTTYAQGVPPGTPAGAPMMASFVGMAATGTAPNPTAAGTGLSAADIALLNSITVPGMGTTSLNTLTPPLTTGPVLGDTTAAAAPDPFMALGSTFVGTDTSGSFVGTISTDTTTTIMTDPIAALAGTTSTEQFVSDVSNDTTTTTTTTTTVIASPSQ